MSQSIEDIKHSDREHASIGPSSMSRFFNCTPWKVLSKGLNSPPSKHSERGTKCHELGEIFLREMLDGKELTKVTLKEVDYDESIIDTAMGFATYCYDTVKPYLHYKHLYKVEEKVILDASRDIWGTADFIFAYSKENSIHIIVIDLKAGFLKVETLDNPQLITYGLACGIGFGRELGSDDAIESMELHIYQPEYEGEFATKPVQYNYKELKDEYLHKIIGIADQVIAWEESEVDPDELYELTSAGSWCQFCPVRQNGKCRRYYEQFEHIFNKLKNAIEVMTKDELKNKESVKSFLTADELRFIYDNKTALSNILNTVKWGVEEEVNLNGSSERLGLKRVATSKKTAWIKDEEQLIEGLKKAGIEEPVQVKESIVSISAVKSKLKKGFSTVTHLVEETGQNYKYVPLDEDGDPVGDSTNDDINDILKEIKNG